jgi:hypothetical protein
MVRQSHSIFKKRAVHDGKTKFRRDAVASGTRKGCLAFSLQWSGETSRKHVQTETRIRQCTPAFVA